MSYKYFIKMDKLEYHAVIKFFDLEIHPKLKKLTGTLLYLFQSFKSGKLNLNVVTHCSEITHMKDGKKLQQCRGL